MSDNLPNQNNDPNPWDTPQSTNPEVPSTPNSPPTPPSGNNTVDPVQSWVAQHEQRDSSGKFVSSDHLTNGQPTPPDIPISPATNSGQPNR